MGGLVSRVVNASFSLRSPFRGEAARPNNPERGYAVSKVVRRGGRVAEGASTCAARWKVGIQGNLYRGFDNVAQRRCTSKL